LWPATDDDFAAWVGLFADPLRAKRAFWHLVLSGAPALPAVREGLRHSNPEVRRYCTKVLDHLVDEESFGDLVRVLDDPDPRVRADALHALACDRCKQGGCLPSKDAVLGPAIDALLHDPDKHVRAHAVGVVGRWVHSDESAVAALIAAREQDPDPSVRKRASWDAPGGTIFTKTLPRPPRR